MRKVIAQRDEGATPRGLMAVTTVIMIGVILSHFLIIVISVVMFCVVMIIVIMILTVVVMISVPTMVVHLGIGCLVGGFPAFHGIQCLVASRNLDLPTQAA
jgi:hypothetical protein